MRVRIIASRPTLSVAKNDDRHCYTSDPSLSEKVLLDSGLHCIRFKARLFDEAS